MAITNIVEFLKEIAPLLLVKHLFDKEYGRAEEIIVGKSASLYNQVINRNGYSVELTFIEIQLLVLNLRKLLHQAALKESTCNSLSSKIEVSHATLLIVEPLLNFCDGYDKYLLFQTMEGYPSPTTERLLLAHLESEVPNKESSRLLLGFWHLKGRKVENALLHFYHSTDIKEIKNHIIVIAAQNEFELREWDSIFVKHIESYKENPELPHPIIKHLLATGMHIEQIISFYQNKEEWNWHGLASLSVYCAAENIKSESLLSTEDILKVSIKYSSHDHISYTAPFFLLRDIHPGPSHWSIIRNFLSHELLITRRKGFGIFQYIISSNNDSHFDRLNDGQYLKTSSDSKRSLKIPEDIYQIIKEKCLTFEIDPCPEFYITLSNLAQLEGYSKDISLLFKERMKTSQNEKERERIIWESLRSFREIDQNLILRPMIMEYLSGLTSGHGPHIDLAPKTQDPEIINLALATCKEVNCELCSYAFEKGLLEMAYS